jgi:FkbM family methyltransferase
MINVPTEQVKSKTNRIWIIEENDSLYKQRLVTKGYQTGNLIRLRHLCPNPRHIIDIGANIGNNSVEYATYAGRVSAFEPTPWTRQWLEDNIAYNQTVKYNAEDLGWYPQGEGWADMNSTAPITVYPYALSNKTYNTTMRKYIHNGGHNHLEREGRFIKDRKTGVETWDPNWRYQGIMPAYPVEVRTLDSFNFTEVDAIKIDVEGWELPVLQGGEKLVAEYRPIIQTEIVEEQCKTAGYDVQELCDWFADRGYIRTLKDGRVMPQKYQTVKKFMDSFWVPQEKLKDSFNSLFEVVS